MNPDSEYRVFKSPLYVVYGGDLKTRQPKIEKTKTGHLLVQFSNVLPSGNYLLIPLKCMVMSTEALFYLK